MNLPVILLAIVGGTIVIVVSVCLFAWIHVCPPKFATRRSPSDSGISYEDISFCARDGLCIRGWLTDVGKRRGIIILCHGYAFNRSMMLEFLPFLNRAGFQVLLFDFRASGRSDGRRSTLGQHEVRDLLGAVDYLSDRPDTVDVPIGVLGLSMGGAVAIMAAAECEQIKGVVADSSFATLERAALQRFKLFLGPLGPLIGRPAVWFAQQFLGVDLSSVQPVSRVSQISPRPLFLIHGDRDRMILPADSLMLFNAGREPKELWIVEGAGHGASHRTEIATYERKTAEFFSQALA